MSGQVESRMWNFEWEKKLQHWTFPVGYSAVQNQLCAYRRRTNQTID